MEVECTELDVLFFVLFVAIFAYCLGFWILQQFELDSGKWSWGFGPNFQRGWRIIWPGNHCMVLCFSLYRNIRCRNVLEECIRAVLRLLYMCSVKRCGEEPWLLGSLLQNRELKQRRSWATHVNKKWTFFCFNIPLCYQISIAKCLYSYREDLPKISFKVTAQECKSPRPVDMRRSKTSRLKLYTGTNVVILCRLSTNICYLVWTLWAHFRCVTFIGNSKRPQAWRITS